MADLFHEQAKSYAESRPSCPAELFQVIASKTPNHQRAWDAKSYAEARHGYPAELFQFIASKTPNHQLAWDAGTGTGQAAISLAGIYEKVVATDASEEQIAYATKLPNIRYQHTPPTMSIAEVERDVAAQGSVDVVTVAQAFHWFDQPAFYEQAKWVLRKPGGVLAVWCSTLPRVNKSMDDLLDRFFVEIGHLWESPVKMVFEQYRGLKFPFEVVEGTDHTGPFEFEEKKMMSLDAYLTYIRSWSAYRTAKDKGIELLSEKVVDEFRSAWGEESDQTQKLVRFPIFLRIGKLGQEEKN